MAHNHNHSHGSSKNIVVAFFLNLIFAFIELIGGYLTNSVSIMSDALHDFGDCVSLAVAWGLQKKSKKRRDNKFSYGYKRFSLLGAVFMSVILLVSSIFILIEASKRLINPEMPDAHGMFWLSLLGIGVNLLAAFRLKKGSSLNERAVFLHIIEDVLGWVAVLIGSIVMIFIELPIIDPILSIIITIWVLVNVFRNLKATFNVFLQGVPVDVDTEKLTSEILNVKSVRSIHDLHIWSFDGETHAMTIHIVVDSENIHDAKKTIRDIAKKYNITHTTIEIEGEGEACEYINAD